MLGAAAGGITFDQEQLCIDVRLAATIGQLARQAVAFEAVLAARQLSRLARGLARFRRKHALLEDRLRVLRIFLEIAAESFVDHRADEAFDLAVAELRLRLPFELRLGHLHADDGDQAFAHVVAARANILDPVLRFGVTVHRPGERGLESR